MHAHWSTLTRAGNSHARVGQAGRNCTSAPPPPLFALLRGKSIAETDPRGGPCCLRQPAHGQLPFVTKNATSNHKHHGDRRQQQATSPGPAMLDLSGQHPNGLCKKISPSPLLASDVASPLPASQRKRNGLLFSCMRAFIIRKSQAHHEHRDRAFVCIRAERARALFASAPLLCSLSRQATRDCLRLTHSVRPRKERRNSLHCLQPAHPRWNTKTSLP
jgi:hypothetical protein